MSFITSATLWAVDLPFKHVFKHAAKERETSSSLFLRLEDSDAAVGWGEALPRPYVTRESREEAFELLHRRILPKLVGMRIDSLVAALHFLEECDGKAPAEWVEPAVPQSAAWAAVDLALLDLAGRREGHPAFADPGQPPGWRHSGVVSAGSRGKLAKSAAKQRLIGLPQLKVKVDAGTRASDLALLKLAAPGAEIRVDANMGWTVDQALELMPEYDRQGVVSFEQPLPREDLEGMSRLVSETGLHVMADESLCDRASLEALVERRACTAVNVRVSKCGGIVASLARCREAAAAGLLIQIGCQVGESSLLSAAQRYVLERVPEVRWVEGAFGLHLLAEDPATPLLQFGLLGRPPSRPTGPGLGCEVDEKIVGRFGSRRARVSAGP